MIPSLVIAGTHSGVGKTSVALGLMAALRRRGLRVQPFKVGPDYLDPLWHRIAAGRTSYNLDSWMTSLEYIHQLYEEKTAEADIAIVEGVMGLFDGALPTSSAGSTAEVSSILDAPVLLVASARGVSRSFAATIRGFSEFEKDCHVVGVLANDCGSKHHADILDEALAAAKLCGLTGWLPKGSLPELPSRHLGLNAPQKAADAAAICNELADAVEQGLDIEALLGMVRAEASRSPSAPVIQERAANHHSTGDATLAVAVDEAFFFYYADNLELLKSFGIKIVEFSPIRDRQLPPGTRGIYLGGGYPEQFAEQLSLNQAMTQAIRNFADTQRPIYAECGGLMYLSQALSDQKGKSWLMVGVLPFSTRMLSRRKRLGYTETRLQEQGILGPTGTVLRGHEFHYSEIIDTPFSDEWHQPFEVTGARGGEPRKAGFARGNILASYIHQHFHSNPAAARSFARGMS
ncbi:MAG: cobyrinic acid a,c-diamide synthase [Planctomycetes bacterium]|nr:cobyrinic acid a,c-diamide synthase [Planctomycetota bacterium]